MAHYKVFLTQQEIKKETPQNIPLVGSDMPSTLWSIILSCMPKNVVRPMLMDTVSGEVSKLVFLPMHMASLSLLERAL